VRRLFAAACGLNAALLFGVQPMMGKRLLPFLGGGPSVWSACLVFFQIALLAGYLWAHFVGKIRSGRTAAMVHGALLLAACVLNPAVTAGWSFDLAALAGGTQRPLLGALVFLGVGCVLPFVALSATGPLLQRWFAAARPGENPYPLYAWSNLGSFAGLLSYPFLVEPRLSVREQLAAWSVMLAVGAAFTMLCGARSAGAAGNPLVAAAASREPPAPVSVRAKLGWIGLSATTSALLIATSQHLTSDVAAVPMLWIPPLAIYLLSFVVAFSARGGGLVVLCRWIAPLLAMAVAIIAMTDLRTPLSGLVLTHLALLTAASIACHGVLYERRPKDDRGLTLYYLMIAVGGALGGLGTTLVAPLVFKDILEYPIAIIAACVLAHPSVWPGRLNQLRAISILGTGIRRVVMGTVIDVAPALVGLIGFAAAHHAKAGGTAVDRWWLFALAGIVALPRRVATALVVAGALAVPLVFTGEGRELIYADRSFYGLHRVYRLGQGQYTAHELWHGRIVHGHQFVNPPLRDAPSSYYFKGGPMNDVMVALYLRGAAGEPGGELPRVKRAGFVGLGTGTLAYYGRKDWTVDFFEIDPAVVRIASDPKLFTYVTNARSKPRFILGDARITLGERRADAPYDLILIDAFSSDAIPVHLLTREAVELYLSRLTGEGLVCVHISNKYLDLEPVVAAIAAELHLACLIRHDDALSSLQVQMGKSASSVMVLAREAAHFGSLAENEEWMQARSDRAADGAGRVWTDERASVLDVMRWK